MIPVALSLAAILAAATAAEKMNHRTARRYAVQPREVATPRD